MTFIERYRTLLTWAGVALGILVLYLISRYDILSSLPYLPIQEWSSALITWLNENLTPLFSLISFIVNGVLDPITYVFTNLPDLIVMAAVAGLAYLLSGWRLSLFTVIALLIISAMGYWDPTMVTLSLVLTATFFVLLFGIPLGILKAHSQKFANVFEPVLDFMQTMPLFVYLIPAVLFFQIGNVPGIVATWIFATPPTVRLTSLGIEQIPKEIIEAGHSFGASKTQFLTKIELPLAMPSILMGINQTIMLSLSMVVVASMIGAEGLGQEVLRGITRLKVGQGIASGLGIVFLAMILDRLTRSAWQGGKKKAA